MDRRVEQRLDGHKRYACGAILDVTDNHMGLSRRQKAQIKNTVLDALNEMHRKTLLVIDANEQGMTTNELFMSRMTEDPVDHPPG